MVVCISKPGSKSGPCAEECGHIACIKLREKAEKICPICKKPIGYEKFSREYEERIFHARCLG